jgi:hypothetical protein
MQIRNIVRASVVAGMAFGLSGCFTSGVYRTARTLEKGEGDLGLGFAITKITQTIDDSEESITLPTIIPEISYHLGMADNLEVGGRIAPASLYMDIDLKYRFLGGPDKGYHVAVAPSLGYQSMFLIDGFSLGLPLIGTFDVNKNVAINAAGFARFMFLGDSTDNDDNDTNIGFSGTVTVLGGNLGIELRGETFYIMPAVEFSKWSFDTEVKGGGETASGSADTIVMQGMINFGFIYGREKKQLDRMEKKIDKMDGKLDKALEGK